MCRKFVDVNVDTVCLFIVFVSRIKSIGYGIANKLASDGIDLFLHSFAAYDRMMSQPVEPNELELIHESLKTYHVEIEQVDADFNLSEAPNIVFESAKQRMF